MNTRTAGWIAKIYYITAARHLETVDNLPDSLLAKCYHTAAAKQVESVYTRPDLWPAKDITLLLQDNLNLWIMDRPICLLIRITLQNTESVDTLQAILITKRKHTTAAR